MNKLVIISLVTTILLLNGCGSSSSNTTETTKTTTNPTVNSNISNIEKWTPITTKVACDPETLKVSDKTLDFKYYADGDIKVECQKIDNFTLANYKLDENIDSLKVVQIIKKESIKGSIKDAKGRNATLDGITTYDYQKGTQHIQGNYTYEGKRESIDCIEIYPTILPKTITSENDIFDLLDWEGNELGEYTSTTCPDSYYNEDKSNDLNIDDKNLTWSGNVDMNTNYTLTDSNGKQHLISREMNMKR